MIKKMTQLIRKIKQISMLLLVISFLGCENDDDSNLPQIVAGFTYTVNSDTGTVTFINISENSRSYEWNFGDEKNSTEINPINTYETGEYTVTLIASNAAGASATFEDIITILIPEVITLPIGFDNANVAYDATTFGGASFEVLDNPDLSGTNTVASKVGAITNSGASFEGFFLDLGIALDLTTQKSVKANFWSDTPVDVLLKLEEGTGANVETTANHGGTGWEMITFNFTSDASYSRFTLFVDGPGTTAGTFYIDDIAQIDTPSDPCIAETVQSLDATDFNLTFLTDPGTSIGSFDAQLTTVSNPDIENAVNSSCQVGQVDRNGGALFANNQIDFDAKFDFNANAGFKMKVWSPVAGTNVLVKLEDKTNSGINIEVGATTSIASAWEELTFDFASGESGKYDKIILFFELNTNTTETYYIDDFMLYAGGGSGAVCTAETVESISGADLNMTFMTDQTAIIIEDGGDFEWVDNPDFENAVNSSCKVGKITKLGNNPWDNNQIDLDAKLDFNANEGLKIKVWSASANTEVRVKLEEIGNAGNNIEQFLTTSVAGEWEELTFPFASADSDKFNKIVLFFDLNANNTDTYYFDDLMLYGTGGSGGGMAPTDAPTAPPARDAADVISIYGEAYGAEVGLANVDWDEGSNFAEETIASNKLLKVDFNDFLGTQLNSVVDATEMTNFHMDFWIVDEFAAGQIFNPKWSNHTGGAGETNAFEYTNPIGDTDAKKWISVDIPITDFTGNNTRADLTQLLLAVASTIDVVYVDNIYFYKTGGGGSAVCTAETTESMSATDLNVTLMSDQTANVIEDGADFEWVDNPDFENAVNSSCKVGKITKLGNNPWDNNQIDLDAKLDFNSNTGLKIKVWSSKANTEVRVKLEEIGNAGNNVEKFLTTSVTNGWEELTFPFTANDSDKFNKFVIFFDLNANNTDTYYFDDLMLYGTGSGTGGGGTGTAGELAVNGDFETGDTSDWTTFVDAVGASFAASDIDPSSGSFSGNLIADFEAGTGAAVDAVVKQANLGAGGGVTPNTEYIVSFDLRGSAADGGVFFAEFFSELSGGGTSKAEIITGGPHPLTSSWSTYSYTVLTGSDVSGGITLQLKSSCGPVPNCLVDVFFDNVSIKLK